jgi:hypothetical protein
MPRSESVVAEVSEASIVVKRASGTGGLRSRWAIRCLAAGAHRVAGCPGSWQAGERWPHEREAGPAEQRHGAVEGGHGSDRRAGVPWGSPRRQGRHARRRRRRLLGATRGRRLGRGGRGERTGRGSPTPARRPGAAALVTGRSAGSRCAVRPRPTRPVAGRGRPAAQARVIAPAAHRTAPGGRPCAGCPRSASGGCRVPAPRAGTAAGQPRACGSGGSRVRPPPAARGPGRASIRWRRPLGARQEPRQATGLGAESAAITCSWSAAWR